MFFLLFWTDITSTGFTHALQKEEKQIFLRYDNLHFWAQSRGADNHITPSIKMSESVLLLTLQSHLFPECSKLSYIWPQTWSLAISSSKSQHSTLTPFFPKHPSFQCPWLISSFDKNMHFQPQSFCAIMAEDSVPTLYEILSAKLLLSFKSGHRNFQNSLHS